MNKKQNTQRLLEAYVRKQVRKILKETKVDYKKFYDDDGMVYNQQFKLSNNEIKKLNQEIEKEIKNEFPRKKEYQPTSGYERFLKPLKIVNGYVLLNSTQLRFINLFLNLPLKDRNTRIVVLENNSVKSVNSQAKKMIKEEVNVEEMTEMASELKDAIQKIFPKSFVSVKVDKFLGQTTVDGRFTLGKDKSEYSNGIIDNDPLFHSFSIRPISTGYELTWLRSGVTAKPENKMYYSSKLKTGTRNGKGSKEQMIKNITNVFKKMPALIKANSDKVHNNYVELFKDKGLI